LRNAACGVIQIAENNRVRRARRLAGREQFVLVDRLDPLAGPVSYERPVRYLSLDACPINALYAIRALLDDAPAPHRDVGIAHRLETLCLPVGVLEVIEPPYFVGT